MSKLQRVSPYQPPRVERWLVEGRRWNLLTSSSLLTDFGDYEDVGTEENWGEVSDI